MNSVSLFSTSIAVIATTFGVSFLPQAKAKPLSELSNTQSPLAKITPNISKLSDLEPKQQTNLKDLLNKQTETERYTRKQIECAEIMGVDPSECTKKGHFIVSRKNSDNDLNITDNEPLEQDTRYTAKQIECAKLLEVEPTNCTKDGEFIPFNEFSKKASPSQEKKTTDISDQQKCAIRLDVSLNECNTHGVFINRNKKIADRLLFELKNIFKSIPDTWQDITQNDLDNIINLKIENLDLTTIVEEDLDGLTSLNGLFLINNNLESITLSETLTNLQELYLNSNRLKSFTLPEKLNHVSMLNLSDNLLTSVTLSDKHTNLMWLFLDNNKIKSFKLHDTFTELILLNVSNNELNSFEIPETLINLVWLSANNNNIRTFIVPDTLIKLDEVNLNNNQIESLSLSDKISRINTLNLNNNLLKTFTFHETFTQITKLNLGYNKLTSLKIPNTQLDLHFLDINYNAISNLMISENIIDQLNTGILIKALFTNTNLRISFNKNSEVNIYGTNYQWNDVRTVLKKGIIKSTKNRDVLQISNNFEFPNVAHLSDTQKNFMVDLEKNLLSHSFKIRANTHIPKTAYWMPFIGILVILTLYFKFLAKRNIKS